MQNAEVRMQNGLGELRLLVVPGPDLTPQQEAGVVALCSAVFQLDYAYLLGLGLERTYVLGYLGDQLMSHALWLHRRLRTGGIWYEVAYVEGVATHPDHRRNGYGSTLMQHLQRAIQDYPFAALSPARADWYLKLGWERWRGPLAIHRDGTDRPTPGETLLIYRTPCTPDLDLDAPIAGEWRSFSDW